MQRLKKILKTKSTRSIHLIRGDCPMRFMYLSLLALLVLAMLFGAAFSQAEESPSNLALGLNVGLQKPYCDVLHTGVGLAGEGMAKLLVTNRFHLSLALGFGMLNDGFTNNTFTTSLITGDLKANIFLVEPDVINPYITLGLGGFGFKYKRTKSWAIGSPALEGEWHGDGSIIFGGGIEIMVTPKMAINAFADYRHTTGDDLDGATVGKSKDGYLNGRAGFTFYFGGRKVEKSAQEGLLALNQEELGESLPGNEKLSTFEAKLDKLDANETTVSMEQYVRLKSRIDELSSLIESKEKELDELRTTLDFKDQRISDLQSELSRISSSGYAVGEGSFNTTYESALRNFYARDYQGAIAVFNDLKNRFPTHKLTSNCQYWIGESYFGLRDYIQAAEAFQAVFNYATSYKKDDATLMLGRCYYNLHDMSRARSYFQGLLSEYPDSEYIEKARQWLNRTG
jgi:tol-pal system protein YbgF